MVLPVLFLCYRFILHSLIMVPEGLIPNKYSLPGGSEGLRQ